jgi:hypothetical protein
LVEGRLTAAREGLVMGRITVSLPESLKTTLKAYANQHDLNTSKVVVLALEAYFQGGSPPVEEARTKVAP